MSLTATLPNAATRNAPFLIGRHDALTARGFTFDRTSDLNGGEGWAAYRKGATVIGLHTNGGCRVDGRHLGYGEPAWVNLLATLDA